jgi:hypothetical protein
MGEYKPRWRVKKVARCRARPSPALPSFRPVSTCPSHHSASTCRQPVPVRENLPPRPSPGKARLTPLPPPPSPRRRRVHKLLEPFHDAPASSEAGLSASPEAGSSGPTALTIARVALAPAPRPAAEAAALASAAAATGGKSPPTGRAPDARGSPAGAPGQTPASQESAHAGGAGSGGAGVAATEEEALVANPRKRLGFHEAGAAAGAERGEANPQKDWDAALYGVGRPVEVRAEGDWWDAHVAEEDRAVQPGTTLVHLRPQFPNPHPPCAPRHPRP